eukprot:TRINITY_DN17900_c0_g1_i8.p1 TRINITY_DN17900_c0_g1~~TRINITY_DN17900_c0_g1_i8.p1  ORF type:complete len:191 (+),score=9.19 TRINITY_DN17900_c0_g1_i8:152-724(+)
MKTSRNRLDETDQNFLIGGDLNQIFKASELQGGVPSSQCLKTAEIMRQKFRELELDWFEDCEATFQSTRRDNNRKVDTHTRKQLDRFLFSTNLKQTMKYQGTDCPLNRKQCKAWHDSLSTYINLSPEVDQYNSNTPIVINFSDSIQIKITSNQKNNININILQPINPTVKNKSGDCGINKDESIGAQQIC